MLFGGRITISPFLLPMSVRRHCNDDDRHETTDVSNIRLQSNADRDAFDDDESALEDR